MKVCFWSCIGEKSGYIWECSRVRAIANRLIVKFLVNRLSWHRWFFKEIFLEKNEKNVEKLRLIRINDRQLGKREVYYDRGR